MNIPQWMIASTEDRLGLLETDLRNCISVGAANRCSSLCRSFWNVLWNLVGVLKVSSGTDRTQRHLRNISVLLLHVRMLQPRTGQACFWRRGALSYCSADSWLKWTRAFAVGIGQPSRSTAWLRTWLPIAAVSAGQRQGPRCEQQTHALPWWGCGTEHRPQKSWISGLYDISSLSLSAALQGWGWGMLQTSH